MSKSTQHLGEVGHVKDAVGGEVGGRGRVFLHRRWGFARGQAQRRQKESGG